MGEGTNGRQSFSNEVQRANVFNGHHLEHSKSNIIEKNITKIQAYKIFKIITHCIDAKNPKASPTTTGDSELSRQWMSEIKIQNK